MFKRLANWSGGINLRAAKIRRQRKQEELLARKAKLSPADIRLQNHLTKEQARDEGYNPEALAADKKTSLDFFELWRGRGFRNSSTWHDIGALTIMGSEVCVRIHDDFEESGWFTVARLTRESAARIKKTGQDNIPVVVAVDLTGKTNITHEIGIIKTNTLRFATRVEGQFTHESF